MWSYDKEIAKIKDLGLDPIVLADIVAFLEAKLPESSVCFVLNKYLSNGMISQDLAYKVMDILSLIDEECLEDRFILDFYED